MQLHPDIYSICYIGGLARVSLIDRHLVTFFVPFLPLEREHIRGCIKQQLQIILENDAYEYELSVEKIINSVLGLVEFNRSPSNLEYSLSGCKKVQQKLNYVFENIRSTLTKRKKLKEEDNDDL